MTVQEILTELKWARISEAAAREQLEQLVAEAREKTFEEVAHYVNCRLVGNEEHVKLIESIVDGILKLKETK